MNNLSELITKRNTILFQLIMATLTMIALYTTTKIIVYFHTFIAGNADILVKGSFIYLFIDILIILIYISIFLGVRMYERINGYDETEFHGEIVVCCIAGSIVSSLIWPLVIAVIPTVVVIASWISLHTYIVDKLSELKMKGVLSGKSEL